MNGKKNNMQTARAKLPRGFADRARGEIAATEKMLGLIKRLTSFTVSRRSRPRSSNSPRRLANFCRIKIARTKASFRSRTSLAIYRNSEIAVTKTGLSLRYDLTAPLARYVAENFDKLPKPYRSYRAGYVFRNEKPGPGRFRQFMQFDADTVGAASVAADAELCMMAADTLERLGIKRGEYVIKVSNRKVLDGVMEANWPRRRGERGAKADGAAGDR